MTYYEAGSVCIALCAFVHTQIIVCVRSETLRPKVVLFVILMSKIVKIVAKPNGKKQKNTCLALKRACVLHAKLYKLVCVAGVHV